MNSNRNIFYNFLFSIFCCCCYCSFHVSHTVSHFSYMLFPYIYFWNAFGLPLHNVHEYDEKLCVCLEEKFSSFSIFFMIILFVSASVWFVACVNMLIVFVCIVSRCMECIFETGKEQKKHEKNGNLTPHTPIRLSLDKFYYSVISFGFWWENKQLHTKVAEKYPGCGCMTHELRCHNVNVNNCEKFFFFCCVSDKMHIFVNAKPFRWEMKILKTLKNTHLMGFFLLPIRPNNVFTILFTIHIAYFWINFSSPK